MRLVVGIGSDENMKKKKLFLLFLILVVVCCGVGLYLFNVSPKYPFQHMTVADIKEAYICSGDKCYELEQSEMEELLYYLSQIEVYNVETPPKQALDGGWSSGVIHIVTKRNLKWIIQPGTQSIRIHGILFDIKDQTSGDGLSVYTNRFLNNRFKNE